MKKDIDFINEAYNNQVADTEQVDEAVAALAPLIGGAARALAPAAGRAVAGKAATSGIGGTIGKAATSKVGQQAIAGGVQAGVEHQANKLQQQQEDSLDDSEDPGRKITDQQRGNRRKVIEDGVNTLVESHCKSDSPLSLREGYEHVKEIADGKLRGLEEIGPLAAAIPMAAAAIPAVAGMIGGK